MANLFVTDNHKQEDLDDDLDLQTCLDHPRVTKVTIMPDGTLVAEVGVVEQKETAGFKGITKEGKRYRARVSIGGIRHSIGTFDTIEEAVQARMRVKGLDL